MWEGHRLEVQCTSIQRKRVQVMKEPTFQSNWSERRRDEVLFQHLMNLFTVVSRRNVMYKTLWRLICPIIIYGKMVDWSPFRYDGCYDCLNGEMNLIPPRKQSWVELIKCWIQHRRLYRHLVISVIHFRKCMPTLVFISHHALRKVY